VARTATARSPCPDGSWPDDDIAVDETDDDTNTHGAPHLDAYGALTGYPDRRVPVPARRAFLGWRDLPNGLKSSFLEEGG
jgi:hypothetical protein